MRINTRPYHDSRVDVPERPQAEQIRTMLRIVEAVRGGLVDWERPGVGSGIRRLTGVNLKGFELELVTGHGFESEDGTRRVTLGPKQTKVSRIGATGCDLDSATCRS